MTSPGLPDIKVLLAVPLPSQLPQLSIDKSTIPVGQEPGDHIMPRVVPEVETLHLLLPELLLNVLLEPVDVASHPDLVVLKIEVGLVLDLVVNMVVNLYYNDIDLNPINLTKPVRKQRQDPQREKLSK